MAPQDSPVWLDEVVDGYIRLVAGVPHHRVVIVILLSQENGIPASLLRDPDEVADVGGTVADAAKVEGPAELVDDCNPGAVRDVLSVAKHAQWYCRDII